MRPNSESQSATGGSTVSATVPNASALTNEVLTPDAASELATRLTSGDLATVTSAIKLPANVKLTDDLVQGLHDATITVKPGSVSSERGTGTVTYIVTTGQTREWATTLAYDDGRWKATYTEQVAR